MGEFPADGLPPADRSAVAESLVGIYRGHADPGLRGAAEWLLRAWGYAERLATIDRDLAGKPAGDRLWYVNPHEQTMVILRGPVEFQIGSPPGELDREGGAKGQAERQCLKRIDRSVAIAAHEVTLADFLKFRPDLRYSEQYVSPDGKMDQSCPVTSVSWCDAVAYCNWLSETEGIAKDQWCYEPDAAGRYDEGLQLAKDYLHRTGYRLPTEAEWEFACRAGTLTARYYGQTDELLWHYAWTTRNSQDRWMLPVGSMKPNDFGLFDMQGNAAEWSQDAFSLYEPGEDSEKAYPAAGRIAHLVRGGSFYNRSAYVRSAYRLEAAVVRSIYFGFRVARTCP